VTKVTVVHNLASFTTDAKFRAWGSACSAAMAAAGFVQTADSGQIDWLTVARPTAAQTTAGYEIWRFDDALQATRPIFFRVGYRTGGNASGQVPGTNLIIGTGSDGAGTITGPHIPITVGGLGTTSASTNTTSQSQFVHSKSNGYGLLNFGLSIITSGGTDWQSAGFYIIERTKNAVGASTSEGVGLTYQTFSSAQTLADKALNFDSGTAYTTVRSPHCGALGEYSLSSGDDIVLYKHYIGAGKAYPALGRLSYFHTDIPSGSTFTSAPLGTSKTYFAYPAFVRANAQDSTVIALAWLWED
jgi:hypothetical protein